MLLVLLEALTDATTTLRADEVAVLRALAERSLPATVVVVGSVHVDSRPWLSAFAHVITIPSFDAPAAGEALAAAILARLPEGKRLAAARALPGLRALYATELIGSVAFANAAYALASAVSEQIPALTVPLAVADIIMLTKNRALMVYRLALAYGTEPDFQDRIGEFIPVLGGGFIWRQIARTLVGLIPFWGIVPKVAVAYAGTYVTGIAAWRWFAKGEALSPERLQELSMEELRLGRERTQALVDAFQRREQPTKPRRRFLKNPRSTATE